MKIEKLSDKQIRCTLTQDDLTIRQINVSELAYGSEKARSLFREMLARASREFGFQAENIPLMIEAVPLSEDSIMLLITKVEEPDEIDTRFARFSPNDSDDPSMSSDSLYDPAPVIPESADDVIEEFSKLCEEALDASEDSPESQTAPVPDYYRIYCFSSLDAVCNAARILQEVYDETNTLFKDPSDSSYCLVLHKGSHTPETFNKICNILSEYGSFRKGNAGTEAFCEEHFEVIVAKRALQILANL